MKHYRKFTLLILLALLLVSVTPLAAQDDTDTEETFTPFGELPLDNMGFLPLDPPPSQFEIIEETEDTITISHHFGETTFPRNPERVISETITAEILLSLEVEMLAYVAPPGRELPIMEELSPETIVVPAIEGPNLEAILQLEPDLIIGAAFWGMDQDLYEQMSAIAPTIPLTAAITFYWDDGARQIATLFDQDERAEEIINDYNERVAELRARVTPVFGDETVSPLIFFGDSANLYSPRLSIGGSIYPLGDVAWLYHEFGLTPGSSLVNYFSGENLLEIFPTLEITGELLPEIQADHLVVFPNGYSGVEDINAGYLDYIASPIWESLPA
ncbi:MAG: ABC transporter substrate-binding protein, partial [Chloroflexota bacterium]